MCSIQQQAIQFNNAGVRQLQSGNNLKAIQLFHHAVGLIKDVRQDISQSAALSVIPKAAATAATAAAVPQTNSNKPSDSASKNTSDNYYVYSKPLVLDISDFKTSKSVGSSVYAKVAVRIVFNLALACHQYGLSSGLTIPLRRAKDCYHLVLKRCRKRKTSDNIMLQCLVWNNLAHLHYLACEHDRCQSCLQRLHPLILLVVQTKSTNDVATTRWQLSQYELEEIMLNRIFTPIPCYASAA